MKIKYIVKKNAKGLYDTKIIADLNGIPKILIAQLNWENKDNADYYARVKNRESKHLDTTLLELTLSQWSTILSEIPVALDVLNIKTISEVAQLKAKWLMMKSKFPDKSLVGWNLSAAIDLFDLVKDIISVSKQDKG